METTITEGWSATPPPAAGSVFTADIDGVKFKGVFSPPFRPLSDQILVKCETDDHRGSKISGKSRIIIPGSADRGYLAIHTGIVMELGCGDVVAEKCGVCEGGNHFEKTYGSRAEVAGKGNADIYMRCHYCNGTGFTSEVVRTTFTVRPGDRVLYHPRDWAHWQYQGEKYIILHEDQHVLGILDDDAIVFAEDQTTRTKSAEFICDARRTNFSKGAH